MGKKVSSVVLILVLLLGFTGAAAASISPFGSEPIPLTEEEMAEIDGEFGAELVKTAVGAAVGGIQYLVTTKSSDWNWADGLRHTVAGALAGLAGALF